MNVPTSDSAATAEETEKSIQDTIRSAGAPKKSDLELEMEKLLSGAAAVGDGAKQAKNDASRVRRKSRGT